MQPLERSRRAQPKAARPIAEGQAAGFFNRNPFPKSALLSIA
jgi:hypothetical protein